MEYDQVFIVEKILDHRGPVKKKTAMEFLVRWKDYGEEYDTWEPYKNVKSVEALDAYKKDHKLKI